MRWRNQPTSHKEYVAGCWRTPGALQNWLVDQWQAEMPCCGRLSAAQKLWDDRGWRAIFQSSIYLTEYLRTWSRRSLVLITGEACAMQCRPRYCFGQRAGMHSGLRTYLLIHSLHKLGSVSSSMFTKTHSSLGPCCSTQPGHRRSAGCNESCAFLISNFESGHFQTGTHLLALSCLCISWTQYLLTTGSVVQACILEGNACSSSPSRPCECMEGSNRATVDKLRPTFLAPAAA